MVLGLAIAIAGVVIFAVAYGLADLHVGDVLFLPRKGHTSPQRGLLSAPYTENQ